MSTVNLDMRGKACPAPVVETKKALDKMDEGIVIVVVDSEVSKNNVRRFAIKAGCNVDIAENNGIFTLTVTKGFTCDAGLEPTDNESRKSSYIIYMNNNVMGHGDPELGSILIQAFFKTLLESEEKPATVVFVNRGVYLVTEGSLILEELKVLAEKFNVEILACGTCLDFYNIKDKIEIGVISNMFDIQLSLISADKVITP